MTEPLTLEELREMGAELERSLNWADMRCRRAIRELIALRESMEQEQQGMPWRQLHKNDLVKLDKLEARHERLRKAAEALKEEGESRLTAEHSALISMGAEFLTRWKRFCAALEEKP